MSIDEENFVVNLANATKNHEEWLSLVRFGLRALLDNQGLFSEILIAEAIRSSEKTAERKPTDAIRLILCELNLKLTLK